MHILAVHDVFDDLRITGHLTGHPELQTTEVSLNDAPALEAAGDRLADREASLRLVLEIGVTGRQTACGGNRLVHVGVQNVVVSGPSADALHKAVQIGADSIQPAEFRQELLGLQISLLLRLQDQQLDGILVCSKAVDGGVLHIQGLQLQACHLAGVLVDGPCAITGLADVRFGVEFTVLLGPVDLTIAVALMAAHSNGSIDHIGGGPHGSVELLLVHARTRQGLTSMVQADVEHLLMQATISDPAAVDHSSHIGPRVEVNRGVPHHLFDDAEQITLKLRFLCGE